MISMDDSEGILTLQNIPDGMNALAQSQLALHNGLQLSPSTGNAFGNQVDGNEQDFSDSDGTRKRRRRTSNAYLTFVQKIQIINKKRENPSISQQQLADWAKEEFGMQASVTQGTISNILKNSAKIMNTAPVDMNTKRKRKLCNEILDNALACWVFDNERKGKKLTGDAIITKARELVVKIRERDPTATTFPDFSAGWLGSFKDRHGIRLNKTSCRPIGIPNAPFDALIASNASATGQLDFSSLGPHLLMNSSEFFNGKDGLPVEEGKQAHEVSDANDSEDEVSNSGHEGRLMGQEINGDVKTDDEYISAASQVSSSSLLMLRTMAGLNHTMGRHGIAISTAPLTIAEKQQIIQQAIEILNDFRIPTKALRTAQYLLGAK